MGDGIRQAEKVEDKICCIHSRKQNPDSLLPAESLGLGCC